MKIAVLVKQVPDTTEMSVDKEKGTLNRQGVPTIINPDDLAGIETALRLKDTYGGEVHAISMGPSQAKSMMEQLYSRGVDTCTLLTDKRFAGSDTWATSNILAHALKKIPFDLIIAGRQAIDGDTAQVGPQVAEFLDIPQATYVEKVIKVEDGSVRIQRAFEDESLVQDVSLPCLITTMSETIKPRYMNAYDIFTINERETHVLTYDDLDLEEGTTGLKGSPTKVKKTFVKTLTKDTRVITPKSPEEAANTIIDMIAKNGGAIHGRQ
ncbi:MAG: electron transfer flavoprotein subunit beta/FixA family protein [Candidatus Izemoplasmataceae bacterium]